MRSGVGKINSAFVITAMNLSFSFFTAAAASKSLLFFGLLSLDSLLHVVFFRIPFAIRNPHHVSGTLFAFQMERKTFLNDKYIQLQAHAFLFSQYIRVEQQRRKVYQTTILCCLLWFEERSIYIITIANISI